MAYDHKNDDQTQYYLILSQGITATHCRTIQKIGAGEMNEVYWQLIRNSVAMSC